MKVNPNWADKAVSKLDKYGVPIAFAFCFVVSSLIYILAPLEHGHGNHLGLRVTFFMGVIWVFYRWFPHKVFGSKWVLMAAGAAGIYFTVHRLCTINPDAEIIHVYRSLFDALAAGKNPYDCLCIFHRGEFDVELMGNFNYPPMEIWPYLLAYKLAGTWNSFVLVSVLIVLQAAVCLVLTLTFPSVSWKKTAVFFPIFVFFEVYTNVATSFLVTALIVYIVYRQQTAPKMWHRVALWFLFGIGILTKFIVLPIWAAYYCHRIEIRNRRSWLDAVMDVAAGLGVACLLMLPFGIENVFRETVLFNMHLDTRAALTTFYPNVLSGLFSWIGLPELYPVTGILVLTVSVLVAQKISLFSALLCACIAFMFVSPTPEPQFFPIILYLGIAGVVIRQENAMPKEKSLDTTRP